MHPALSGHVIAHMINTGIPNGVDWDDAFPMGSLAPRGAPYSGLLECPCTDRRVDRA